MIVQITPKNTPKNPNLENYFFSTAILLYHWDNPQGSNNWWEKIELSLKHTEHHTLLSHLGDEVALFMVSCNDSLDLAWGGWTASKQVLLSHIHVYGSINKLAKATRKATNNTFEIS